MSEEPNDYVMITADSIKIKSGEIINEIPTAIAPKQLQDDLSRFLSRLQQWMQYLARINEGKGLSEQS